MHYNYKQIAAAGASLLFSTAAVRAASPIPLVVVLNSLCHHYFFPSSKLAYLVDLGFNSAAVLKYSVDLPSVRFISAVVVCGYALGQANGGCNTRTGVWTHVLLCQAPGALGSVIACCNRTQTQLSQLDWCLVCGWAWAVVERLLLPRTIHDRARVAWAAVCLVIGIISSVQGAWGFFVCSSDNKARINSLLSLRIAHEIGSLVVEICQRKPTSAVFCAHHVLFLLMTCLHRPDWHDANARAYRFPSGDVVYTEKDVLYLIGCTEISSVFLQAIAFASDRGWPLGGIVSRSLMWSKPVFAVAYLVVRVLWWPVHAWPLVYRTLCLSSMGEYNLIPKTVALCTTGLSAMQLRWAHAIAYKAIASLQRQRT